MVKRDPARRRGEEGYNLVFLIVAITILNVLVAVALPLWSHVIRRDKEEETIFRGLQYAEAIRVFQQRFGRYPTSLAELVEVEPRSIRQLWKEPLTDDGEFGLVIEGPPPAPQGQQPSAPPPGQAVTIPADRAGRSLGGFGIGGRGRQIALNLIKLPRTTDAGQPLQTTGPIAIHGVYLDHEGDSIRGFFGQERYEEWAFVAELIVPPVTAPDRPLPRVRDDWLGKAFPKGLVPAPGPGGAGRGPSSGPTFVPQGSGPKRDSPRGERKESDDDDRRPAREAFPEDPTFPEDDAFPEDEPDLEDEDSTMEESPEDHGFPADEDLLEDDAPLQDEEFPSDDEGETDDADDGSAR